MGINAISIKKILFYYNRIKLENKISDSLNNSFECFYRKMDLNNPHEAKIILSLIKYKYRNYLHYSSEERIFDIIIKIMFQFYLKTYKYLP